ncbi:MAG: 2-hydroxychromene-2-carboxylate isomerase [Gammaproteobacteria bacterium]|nr:2-hydroxychromene-2-carboxylate isomerase [Gammaproteobacteria bacterium]
MQSVEFFFDCSSPWTYLGFEQIQRTLARGVESGAVELVWRPFLVGGVFNTVNPSVYEGRAKPVPVKARHYAKDLADWARYVGIRIGSPPVFPVNSVKAMRGAFFAEEQGVLVPYARRVFERYWGDLADVSQDDVLEGIVGEVGLDATAFFAAIRSDGYKARLRANTDELIERGGYGSPTMFVDSDDMYFGNDRIPLVAHRLGLAPPKGVA